MVFSLISYLFFFSAFLYHTSSNDSYLDGIEPEKPLISSQESIMPYLENPWYWQYKGNPLLLRGGSDDDNLFQWEKPDLIAHLELLQSVGGNYLRNTMSDRDEGNLFAFKQEEGNHYNLNEWDEAYWKRFSFFLEETGSRDIIVQLTLWDQFDLDNPDHPWLNNNNLAENPIKDRADFNNTISNNNQEGLKFQKLFIDKILSYTLAHDHVLYNINNESSEDITWENFWAKYLHYKADSVNQKIYITTMQLDPSDAVRKAMTFSDLYQFVEISQNNQDSRGGRGAAHYENILVWRNKLMDHPMPMNNEKVYGAEDGVNYSAGTETEAIHRLWRNIFAGCASSRFHRPVPGRAWGIGLNKRAQANLKAVNMFLEVFDLFESSPHNDLLSHTLSAAPSSTEAYCLANMGKQYAVFFPAGRFTINLDPWVLVEKVTIKWLDIEEGKWMEDQSLPVKWEGGVREWGSRGKIQLTTPSNKYYVAIIEPLE